MTKDIEKVNGLHSGTMFYNYYEGRERVEYHEHPKTGELVIMRTWFVSSGEDDVDHEMELVGVWPRVGCMLAKMNAPYMVNGVMPLFKN